MKSYVHHTGIVAPSEEQVSILMDVMGLEEDYRGYVPQWSALCIFTRAAPGSSPIEFVVADAGPLLDFNSGVGGIHHVALAVESLDEVARELAARDMELLEREHVKGAGPFLCNFLSPIYTRGVQLEFVKLLEG